MRPLNALVILCLLLQKNGEDLNRRLQTKHLCPLPPFESSDTNARLTAHIR